MHYSYAQLNDGAKSLRNFAKMIVGSGAVTKNMTKTLYLTRPDKKIVNSYV